MTPTDHDLLIKLSQQMETITVLLTNHLEHHFVYNMTLLGAFVATTTACVLYWLQDRKGRGE